MAPEGVDFSEGAVKKRRRLLNHSKEDDEKPYERLPRTQRGWTDHARNITRLPVILPTGEAMTLNNEQQEGKAEKTLDQNEEEHVPTMSTKQLRRLDKIKKQVENKEKAQKDKKKLEKEMMAVGGQKRHKQLEEVKKVLNRCQTRKQKLYEIATSSNLIMASPESNLYRLDILFGLVSEKLKNQESHCQRNHTISTIALISIGSVMKSIIPGYKIRSDIDTSNQQMSHAFEKLRNYEVSLLSYYERLVGYLQKQATMMPDVVCSIVCDLLYTSPTFNFSDELLDLCIQLACMSKNKNAEQDNEILEVVSGKASDCLLTLIGKDSTLDFAVRISRVVSRVAKSSANKRPEKNGTHRQRTVINGKLLRVLSKTDFTEKEAAVGREAALRGIKEGEKINKEVLKDLHASSIYGDIRKFKKNQAEILKELFVTFLRILRAPKQFPSDSLPGALEGLGRLSHLVNVELVEEILNELQNLILSGDNTLDPLHKLEALTSATRLIKGVGAALNLNATWILDQFCVVLTDILPFFVSDPSAPPSILWLPYNSFKYPPPPMEKRGSKKPSAEQFSQKTKSTATISELHQDDSSELLSRIEEAVRLILNCPSVCRSGVTTSYSNQDKFRLLEALLNLSTSLADPICRISILNLAMTTIEGDPCLSSIFDVEGIIVSGTAEEKSLYWTTELIGTSCIGKSTTDSIFQKLKTLATLH